MVKEYYNYNIIYKPSSFARMVRVFLPGLQRILPFQRYEVVYKWLYASYRKCLQAFYVIHVVRAKLFGDPVEATKRSLTFKLLPYTIGGRRALENAFEITWLVDQKRIEGALVECGVAEGGTAAMMALANRELGGLTRAKWFFDSYEGLPEPTAEDYEGGKAGHFIRPLVKGGCLGSIEQVEDLMFDKLLLSRNEVHLVKGWFQETVPIHREKIGRIAVLRLDGDWYESTKIPLEAFFDQVTPGGYVIIDDYATCFGSRKATDEFLAYRNIITPLCPDGRGGAWFEKPAKNK